jgi:hypothetical protein
MSSDAINDPATWPEKNRKNDTFPTGKSAPDPRNSCQQMNPKTWHISDTPQNKTMVTDKGRHPLLIETECVDADNMGVKVSLVNIPNTS